MCLPMLLLNLPKDWVGSVVFGPPLILALRYYFGVANRSVLGTTMVNCAALRCILPSLISTVHEYFGISIEVLLSSGFSESC